MINIKVLSDCAEVTYHKAGTDKKQTKLIGISEIPGLFDTKISYDSGNLALFGKENAFGIQRILRRDSQTIAFIQGINPYMDIYHNRMAVFEKSTREKLGIDHLPYDEEKGICEEINQNKYLYRNVRFPNLLMVLSLKEQGGRVSVARSGLLAYEDMYINDETQLYDFPFSNTYKGDSTGNICWGGHRVNLDQTSQAVGVMHTFLGGIMNHHLFNPFKIKDQNINCSSMLLGYLSVRAEELERFPYEDIPLKKNIQYKNLVNFVRQNWK